MGLMEVEATTNEAIWRDFTMAPHQWKVPYNILFLLLPVEPPLIPLPKILLSFNTVPVGVRLGGN